MNPAAVAVATMTKVRNDADARLITAALGCLSRTSMPVAVGDAGSPPRFVRDIANLTGITLAHPVDDGLVGQVRASIGAAGKTGRDFILYTEPDKQWFFDRALLDFIHRAPADVGIVLAARSARAFNSYPRFQRQAEAAANALCASAIGIDTDYCYGPFLFQRRLARHLTRAPRMLGWGWRPYLFATAHRLGYRIATVIGEYMCPPPQRVERDADKAHRAAQLVDNACGIVAAVLPGRRSSWSGENKVCTGRPRADAAATNQFRGT
jgi:hypothetical protein